MTEFKKESDLNQDYKKTWSLYGKSPWYESMTIIIAAIDNHQRNSFSCLPISIQTSFLQMKGSFINRFTFLDEVGDISRFVARFFGELIKTRQEIEDFFRQCYRIGYKSLPLVGITAFIMGLVLTIQSRPTLLEFGTQSRLPSMVSVSLVREISPAITALICAAKIGSGMRTELRSMRVTGKIDAMDVSGTNPFKNLVVTRVLAVTLMLPVLSNLSNAIGLYGGYLGVNIRG